MNIKGHDLRRVRNALITDLDSVNSMIATCPDLYDMEYVRTFANYVEEKFEIELLLKRVKRALDREK